MAYIDQEEFNTLALDDDCLVNVKVRQKKREAGKKLAGKIIFFRTNSLLPREWRGGDWRLLFS